MSKEAARKKLEDRPVMVLFYMIGCPHCQRNQPAWEEAKKKMKGKMKVAEIEANETPEETGVSSFPTMMVIKKDGKKKMIAGAQENGGAILRGLGLSTKPRRNTLRRLASRRNRKLRHSTLRNHVALV
jgi:thiol-disulfide isomerase/thioredoxin